MAGLRRSRIASQTIRPCSRVTRRRWSP